MSVKENLYKSYSECKELLEKKSEKDAETDPNESKQKVVEILFNDLIIVKNYIEFSEATDPTREFCRMYLPFVLMKIGILYIERGEFPEGEDYLKQSIDYIENPLLPNTIYMSVETRNHLGYASLRQSNAEKALEFLIEAEKLYCVFRSNLDWLAQNVFEDLEDCPVVGEEELEMAHTMTKFYLAQAYEVLKQPFKSSVYCHETLKRQLKHKNYDPVEWILSSSTLGQFLLDQMLFKQGRSHLAAANHILDEYENSLSTLEGSQEEVEAKKEEFKLQSARMSWCWAKYGLIILEHSRNILWNLNSDIADEVLEYVDRLMFDDLDLTRYEDQIRDIEVVDFENAREVFLFSQRHLNKAKEFYTLEDRASIHTQIVRDHSMLFNFLSAFEQDEERKSKMLKKRADLLEPVLKELNPNYYINICRQLWFELGEIYHDRMEIKADESGEVPSRQAAKKINSLIETGAKHFYNFLDSLKDKKTGNLPDPLQEGYVEAGLTAHFYLGRLHFKYITADKHSQRENSKKAYECYKYLVDYCERNEKAKALVQEKYQICKELVTLLRMRLLRL